MNPPVYVRLLPLCRRRLLFISCPGSTASSEDGYPDESGKMPRCSQPPWKPIPFRSRKRQDDLKRTPLFSSDFWLSCRIQGACSYPPSALPAWADLPLLPQTQYRSWVHHSRRADDRPSFYGYTSPQSRLRSTLLWRSSTRQPYWKARLFVSRRHHLPDPDAASRRLTSSSCI